MKYDCEACDNGPCKSETRLRKPVICICDKDKLPKWKEEEKSTIFDKNAWD